MNLLDVSIGTVAWASIAFILVLVLLKKFAWKPILESLKEREESIENALNEADKARQEIGNLKSENEDLLKEARAERDQILKEAREVKESMITDAKNTAKEEGDRMIANAREAIENEKNAAMAELKNQVATLSIEIAEKVVGKNLSDDEKQQDLVENLVENVKLN